MARSYYYNDSRLNQYIQPRIKKYYNYTHQKLVEEENSIREKINQESEDIKTAEANIKKTREAEAKYSDLQNDLNQQILSEERSYEAIIEEKNTIQKPIKPNSDNIINGRNIICLLLAGFAAFAFGQDKGGVEAFILFVPAFFLVFKVIAYWILKQEDELENNKYYEELRDYSQKIKKQFKPSENYKKNKKKLEQVNAFLSHAKEHINNEFKTIRSKKFEIVLLKKILFEFKRFKKRANERERTAKINAFESKARSGAQNIKEKLLKAVRIKSKWLCPYCNSSNEIKTAEADHIHPVNKGGMTTMQNMVLICKKCNSKKTNLMLRVFCKKQGFNYNEVCERLEKLGKDV